MEHRACLASTLALVPLVTSNALGQVWPYEGEGLDVSVESLDGFKGGPTGEGHARARWAGKLGASEVSILLRVMQRGEFGLDDPADVVSLREYNRARADKANGRPPFAFDEQRGLPGSFGYIRYAWLGFDELREGTKPVETFLCLGGILKETAYSLEVTCRPALLDQQRARIEAFFASGVTYAGEVLDEKWSDEEVEERWKKQAPDSVLEDSELRIVRSKHYVIMTNVGKGTSKGFAKKIDECYERIQAIYPFEDIDGQRLLPIFYFVTKEQYSEWYAKNLKVSLERARRSGGVAYADVYSTYHQATNAPVHIHEATHQIFSNRMQLGGGGSWFQEGVAEYMSSEANELSQMKGIAKRGKHTPFAEFFALQSLLYSSEKDTAEAGDNYDQAAALIEFVRHGKYAERFQDFVHAIGRVPRRDLPAIEKELQRMFGRDIEGFEEDFVAYWTKRKKPKRK